MNGTCPVSRQIRSFTFGYENFLLLSGTHAREYFPSELTYNTLQSPQTPANSRWVQIGSRDQPATRRSPQIPEIEGACLSPATLVALPI